MKINKLILFLIILFTNASCQSFADDDIKTFKNLKLAKAVKKEDTLKIKKIIKLDKVNVDITDEMYNQTLLIWAVKHDKFNSCKKLLELGADPNTKFDAAGKSAIIAACLKDSSKYLKLILEHGGNPNAKYIGNQNVQYPSPVDAASCKSLDNLKLLVRAGAIISDSSDQIASPLRLALLLVKPDIVLYLIKDLNVDFRGVFMKRMDGTNVYISDYLRDWVFPLDSKNYKIKMEIVDYLKVNGIDYRKSPIPEHLYKQYPTKYLNSY